MAISGENWTSFPKGFLVGASAVSCPQDFIPGPILENFYVHPELRVKYAGNRTGFVIVLGTAYSTEATNGGDSSGVGVEGTLLSAMEDSFQSFVRTVATLAGRYVLIVGNHNEVSIFPDATAMRSVFYHRESRVAGSHAGLVAQVAGAQLRNEGFPIKGVYPGNLTPFDGVKILTPNFSLSIRDFRQARFWPFQKIESSSVGDAARDILQRATWVFQQLAKDFPVKMALTAGLDSRMSLAVGVNSGCEFGTYTYGKTRDTRIDRRVAPDLAGKFGVDHKILKTRPIPEELKSLLEEATYWDHHWSAVAPLSQWLAGSEPAIVTTNILEIGRRIYAPFVDKRGLAEPIEAKSMGALYYNAYAAKRIAPEVREYGIEKYKVRRNEIFAEWLEDTGGLTPEYIDPFEQFFWEYRMPTWHGPMQVERDFYGEPTNLFNSHVILEKFLSVSKYEQRNTAVFLDLISRATSGLLEIPINPQEWPVQKNKEL